MSCFIIKPDRLVTRKCVKCATPFKTRNRERPICENCIIKEIENDPNLPKDARIGIAAILRLAKTWKK